MAELGRHAQAQVVAQRAHRQQRDLLRSGRLPGSVAVVALLAFRPTKSTTRLPVPNACCGVVIELAELAVCTAEAATDTVPVVER